MEQRVDDKGRERKGTTDGQVKKVVATRTVDKLLEQSRLSSPGSVRHHEPEKKEAGDGGSSPEVKAEERGKGKKHDGQRGSARLDKLGSVGRWFQILCFMHIPVFGFLYMLVKALRRKTPAEERHFAAAYLLYRILILFLALTILYILYKVGLQFVDGILDYAGMGK